MACITVTNVSPPDSSLIFAYQWVGQLPLRLAWRSLDQSLFDLKNALNNCPAERGRFALSMQIQNQFSRLLNSASDGIIRSDSQATMEHSTRTAQIPAFWRAIRERHS
jgi:hypothetical protein